MATAYSTKGAKPEIFAIHADTRTRGPVVQRPRPTTCMRGGSRCNAPVGSARPELERGAPAEAEDGRKE